MGNTTPTHLCTEAVRPRGRVSPQPLRSRGGAAAVLPSTWRLPRFAPTGTGREAATCETDWDANRARAEPSRASQPEGQRSLGTLSGGQGSPCVRMGGGRTDRRLLRSNAFLGLCRGAGGCPPASSGVRLSLGSSMPPAFRRGQESLGQSGTHRLHSWLGH